MPEAVNEPGADQLLPVLGCRPWSICVTHSNAPTYKFGEFSIVLDFLAKFLNTGSVSGDIVECPCLDIPSMS